MDYVTLLSINASVSFTINYDLYIEYDGFSRPQSFVSVNSVEIDKKVNELKANPNVSNIRVYTVSCRTVS